MKPTLIMVPLICWGLVAAAAPFPEKPLKDLIAESDHIVIGTITKVDMVDSWGKEQSSPELASTIRLHLTVQKNGVLKTDAKDVADKLLVSLSCLVYPSIGQLTKEEGSKYIFLFNRDIYQSMEPVYASGFFQELSKQREIEQLIQEGLRAEKAGEGETDDIREAVFRWQFDHNPLRQQPNAPEVYFLRTEKHFELPDEFMKRFADNQPPVRTMSRRDAASRDRRTGEHGVMFWITSIKWESDTEVDVGSRCGWNGGASGNTYIVKKENGKWRVTNDMPDFLYEI
jgi:hypothetical protein